MPWLLPLLLTGCFYATLHGGYAPAVTAAPAAVSLSFHEGAIPTAELTTGARLRDTEYHWFGDGPLTWCWGAFARVRAGLEQAQIAAGPEIAAGLNPERSAVVPFVRVGVHLLQVDRYRGVWGGAVGSPLAEVGLASCRFWHDVPCMSLSAVIERDLRFGPAPDTTQVTLLAGAGVGF
jgi:hypothetical protein